MILQNYPDVLSRLRTQGYNQIAILGVVNEFANETFMVCLEIHEASISYEQFFYFPYKYSIKFSFYLLDDKCGFSMYVCIEFSTISQSRQILVFAGILLTTHYLT